MVLCRENTKWKLDEPRFFRSRFHLGRFLSASVSGCTDSPECIWLASTNAATIAPPSLPPYSSFSKRRPRPADNVSAGGKRSQPAQRSSRPKLPLQIKWPATTASQNQIPKICVHPRHLLQPSRLLIRRSGCLRDGTVNAES